MLEKANKMELILSYLILSYLIFQPRNFLFDTNIQQHNVHQIIKDQVTLTKAEGEGQRLHEINKW